MPTKLPPLAVTINSTGRQAASFVRVASAIGWRVRAQVRREDNLFSDELGALPNVSLLVGELDDESLIEDLFHGAQLAFINTTHWGDELKIGCALADAADKAGIKHYVYSSMPDHATYNKGWKGLPLWAHKFQIESYIRELAIPSTFVYAGIYNNNFTSLPYPLFRMALQPDKTFVWQAPFHPSDPLPWLDAEHDVGPALLQIFKEGPERWGGHRIPLAFEVLTPEQVCDAFSKALNRPVMYRKGPIDIVVPIPRGYRDHLEALEEVLGKKRAPYFGPDIYYPNEAIELWEGNRGMEEYAREVFVVEERMNGMTWMEEGDSTNTSDFGDDELESAQGTDASSIQGNGKDAELNFTGSC